MADNLFYTVPSTGALIATDELSGSHYQWMKLDVGGPNQTVPITGSIFGLPVDIQRFNVPLPAGTNNIGDVDVATLPPLPAGSSLIGNVNVRTVSGIVSTANSSTTPLGADGVFAGTAEDVTHCASVTVFAYSDRPSKEGGLRAQWSTDGLNWHLEERYTVSASAAISIPLRPKAQFFRVLYENGSSGQSILHLQTIYRSVAVQPQQNRVRTVTIRPTISTTAYANGDNVAGLQAVTGFVNLPWKSGILQTITVVDKDKEKPKVDLVFFKSNPFNSTFTDNAAQAIADADLDKILFSITVNTADYIEFSDNAVATVGGLSRVMELEDTTLYLCIVIRQGKTFTSTSDISVTLTFLPD